MRTPRLLASLAALVCLALPTALLAAPTPAAPGTPVTPELRGAPGTWTRVSTGTVLNIAEPGLYRTPDDRVLHLVYLRQGATSDSLAYTNIAPTGSVDSTGVAVAGWAGLPQDPKVVGTPGGGMRLVFGGIHDTSGGDPYDTGQMFSATTDASGAAWSLEPGVLTESHSAYASYGTGATTLVDGTPVVSFPLNSTVTWNAGSATDSTFTVGSCCVYDTTLARDGDDVWVAYAGNGGTAATAGVFVRQLLPSEGASLKAPGSSEGTDTLTPSQSTAFVARPGGGLYAAYCIGYPTCDRIGLWRLGTPAPVTVPGSRNARDVALSTGPGGRLWVAWTTSDRVRVVHTGASGLHFGAVRTIKPPRAAESLYGVFVAGSDGSADVLLNNGSALYHQIVLPGLSLSATPTHWRTGHRQQVTFTVADAGDGLGGARIAAGGTSCTTAGNGRCSITFPPSGRRTITATARHAGYGADSVRLRIR